MVRGKPQSPRDTSAAPATEDDLLEDLRNLIVTDESRGIREIVKILGDLQSRIEDRQGLTALLRPVIMDVLRDGAREDPEALRALITPIVREILHEDAGLVSPPATPSAARFPTLLRRARDRAAALLAGARSPREPTPEHLSEPAEGLEPCDVEFALNELFCLAAPSLVLLAHGSWLPIHQRAQNGEQFLVNLRRFIRAKSEGGSLQAPLRARLGPRWVHVEPGKHAHLLTVYGGAPPVGFFLDLRQTLADLHLRFTDALRRAQAGAVYRPLLRLLMDRYRPSHAQQAGGLVDPLTWPPPE